MFEIALNKSTVLLSTRGLGEHILTIEALILAQGAIALQWLPALPALCLAFSSVTQHPLLEHRRKTPCGDAQNSLRSGPKVQRADISPRGVHC